MNSVKLITKADILKYWPISVNLDDSRVNPWIVRAQDSRLSAILGASLYLALQKGFIANFTNPDFANGLTGWGQVVGDKPWTAGTFGATVAMTLTDQSAILNQKIATPLAPFRITGNVSQAGTVVKAIFVAWSGTGVPEEIGSITSLPLGPFSLLITPTKTYEYVGVYMDSPTGSGNISLSSFNLVMEDRLDKLFYGDIYQYDTNYDQRFTGVYELLCAYSYAFLVDNDGTHVTRGGVVKKTTEQSENMPPQSVSVKSQDAYSEAIRLEGEFFRYMSVKNANYPEYMSTAPSQPTALNFWNASKRGCGRYGY